MDDITKIYALDRKLNLRSHIFYHERDTHVLSIRPSSRDLLMVIFSAYKNQPRNLLISSHERLPLHKIIYLDIRCLFLIIIFHCYIGIDEIEERCNKMGTKNFANKVKLRISELERYRLHETLFFFFNFPGHWWSVWVVLMWRDRCREATRKWLWFERKCFVLQLIIELHANFQSSSPIIYLISLIKK